MVKRKGKNKSSDEAADGAPEQGTASTGSQAVPENGSIEGQAEPVGHPDGQPKASRKKKPKKAKPIGEANVQKFPNLVWRAGDPATPAATGGKRKREDSVVQLSKESKAPRQAGLDTAETPKPPLKPATKYLPIVESQLVPPHLRHPFRTYPSTTKFDISQAIKSEPVTERYPTDAYFELAARVPNAFWPVDVENSDQREVTQRRKLVVLDLNGALVVRSERTERYVAQTQRKVFARPFLNCFLDYLMSAFGNKKGKQPASQPQRMRPYEVFIWSSAQPKSIDDMINSTFSGWARSVHANPLSREQMEDQIRKAPVAEKRVGRVLGVWSRAEMGLTQAEYFQKSATLKDLEKLYRHFERGDTSIKPNSRFYHPDPLFRPDPTNTLLIDDSTDKASLQPYNHLPILDFDWKMLKKAAEAVDADEKLHGVRKKIKPVDALRLIFGASASEFYHRHVARDSTAKEESEEKTVDGILLAIIGILSEISDVESIPAWIAAGGLQPDIEHTFTEEIATRGWEHIVGLDAIQRPSSPPQHRAEKKAKKRKVEVETAAHDSIPDKDSVQNADLATNSTHDSANSTPAIAQQDPTKHVVPQTLPSHPEYQHWYNSPGHVLYWVRRGLVALEERGVSLQHNMSGVGERIQKAELERQSLDNAAKAREAGVQGPSSGPRARYFSGQMDKM